MRLFLSALFLLAACGIGPGTFDSKHNTDLEARKIRRIAVFPLEALSGEEKAKVPFSSSASVESPAALISRHLYTALSQMPNWQIISDREVREMMPLVPPGSPEGRARRLGQLVYADAVISGRLLRFREREGESIGVKNPASVAFVLELWDIKRGDSIWTARFDETQKPLSENLFALGQVGSRGVRWLTAEELARDGVRKSVAELHQALYRKPA
jgi:hypothetical protein